MDFDDAVPVDTEEPIADDDFSDDYPLTMDQAYLVPESRMSELPEHVAQEADGRYVLVEWPDAAACEGDKDVIYDIDGNPYVSIES